MGVPHLMKLRDYLQQNADKSYSKTFLRDTLSQNFKTIGQNLDYLVEIEKVVRKLEKGKKDHYQWKQ